MQFLNEYVWISIKILSLFVPKGLIENKSVLVQVMAWRETGDQAKPETMVA